MKFDLRFWKVEPSTKKEFALGAVWTILICANFLALVWTFFELIKHYGLC